jgi:hypothetical protein
MVGDMAILSTKSEFCGGLAAIDVPTLVQRRAGVAPKANLPPA